MKKYAVSCETGDFVETSLVSASCVWHIYTRYWIVPRVKQYVYGVACSCFVLLMKPSSFYFAGLFSQQHCQTPARPHPRVKLRTINICSSSFLISTFPCLCLSSSTSCPSSAVMTHDPLTHPHFSAIQHLSTNPRFPPFNLRQCLQYLSTLLEPQSRFGDKPLKF